MANPFFYASTLRHTFWDSIILCITDKQFGEMEIFSNCKPKTVDTPCQQLELF